MLNKNKILSILCVLLFSLVLFSKSVKGQSHESSLLWQITGDNVKDTSYLFGTIHLIPKKHFFVPYGLEVAFKKSSVVYFEIDMANMNDMGAQMALLPKMMMLNDTTLTDLYTEEELEEVGSAFEAKGLPFFFFQKFKPMFIQLLFQVDLTGMNTPSTNMESYEFWLMGMAEEQNKPTAGVETIDFQVSIFDSIPYRVQAKMLLETIKTSSDMNEEESDMDALYEIYKSQDLNKLQDMLTESEDPITKEFGELFLFKRNENWIPVMQSVLKDETAFFAFGAAHLPGERGVIQLLREQGYTVTPVVEK